VTGQKSDVLELAARIVDVCREHTSSVIFLRAAIQIADTVIASGSPQFAEQPASTESTPALSV
jgi:hypothetical protein